jgi:hypothetical protein
MFPGLLLTPALWCAIVAEPRHTANEIVTARVVQAAAAALHRAPETVVAREIPARFFSTWQFWRAEDDDIPPSFVHLATHAGQTVRVDEADGFRTIVATEPLKLATPDEAVEYVKFFLSLTKPLVYVLASIDDVPFVTDGVRARQGANVRPPHAKADGAGYSVDAWLFDSGDLVRARFAIDSRGAVHPTLETVEGKAGLNVLIE